MEGIRESSDMDPGLRRRRCGKGWSYLLPDNSVASHSAIRRRINDLRIPPAWRDVWICLYEDGHLQATGRDTKGRKQYLYHHKWRAWREEIKYEKMVSFASKLPSIRRKIYRRINRAGFDREHVLAAAVSIIDQTGIRVGNEEYAKQNNTYGLSTLTSDHMQNKGPRRVFFEFVGKSGKHQEVVVEDPGLSRLLVRLDGLPGREILKYERSDGSLADVSARDINSFIKAISEDEFTAKDFRTWKATVEAARRLSISGVPKSKTARKKVVVSVGKEVADLLGNTAAVARSSYISPRVIDSYEKGVTIKDYRREAKRCHLRGLRQAEAQTLIMLQNDVRLSPAFEAVIG